jgi:hypothetical protein
MRHPRERPQVSQRHPHRKNNVAISPRLAQWLDANAAVFVGVRQMLFETGRADALVEMTIMGRHADEGQVRVAGPGAALKAAVGGDSLASRLLTKARGHGSCSFGGCVQAFHRSAERMACATPSWRAASVATISLFT